MTEVQKVILSIYKEIKKICDAHKINYYAIGGTCIGTIRHKGFIPWDDDIDIAIPIEQYDLFLQFARTELPNYLYVLTCDDAIHYPNGFAKICDNRTMFIMRSSLYYPDSYKGVFVDIMPISGIPVCRIPRLLFCKRIKLLGWLNIKRRYGSGLIQFILKAFPFNFFSSHWIRLLRMHPFKKSKITGYVWWPSWIELLVFPTSFMGDPIELKFEDTTMKCPREYHNYLSFQFGDYMTLPPLEKQITHHGFIDLNNSFKYYQKHPELIVFSE